MFHMPFKFPRQLARTDIPDTNDKVRMRMRQQFFSIRGKGGGIDPIITMIVAGMDQFLQFLSRFGIHIWAMYFLPVVAIFLPSGENATKRTGTLKSPSSKKVGEAAIAGKSADSKQSANKKIDNIAMERGFFFIVS